MDRQERIENLKRTLVRDVAALFQRSDIQWRAVISEMASELKEADVPAVIFGGTLRSLLLSRLNERHRFGRPRDLDIVVAGENVERIEDQLREHVVRKTRFGGLKLQRSSWHFDVWPLHKTWAIIRDESLEANFQSLPCTTFFNLEAVAVDLWVERGRKRIVYSGDDQFFDGLIDRTIEINREENPFPALCVVRSLVFAFNTEFSVGPRLARYLAAHRDSFSDSELESIQHHHYGSLRISSAEIRKWVDHIAAAHERAPQSRIKLPKKQGTFWDDDGYEPRLCLHVVNCPKRK